MAKGNNPDRCIRCNACLPEFPAEGVTVTNTVFVIDPRLCGDCAGMYARSLCAAAALDAAEAGESEDAPARRRRGGRQPAGAGRHH